MPETDMRAEIERRISGELRREDLDQVRDKDESGSCWRYYSLIDLIGTLRRHRRGGWIADLRVGRFDSKSESIDALVAAENARRHANAPIPMLLFCPRCHLQHVDKPEPERGWSNPIHRSHTCKEHEGGCGLVWRPADVATTGVETIATRGKADTWSAPPVESDDAILGTTKLTDTANVTPGGRPVGHGSWWRP